MEKTRELANDWHLGCIHVQRVGQAASVCLPVIYRDHHDLHWTDNEWFPGHAAPDRCFKPAEPDGALEAGERVYVDCPEMDGFDRMTGWADIVPRRALDPDKVGVCFVGEQFWHPVLRAACHRDGPQSEPPAEGAVFLGRDPRRGRDCWWYDGNVYLKKPGSGWVAHLPCVIESGSDLAPALAVARELGLVEAEKDEPAPEQKFQMGQEVEREHPRCKFRIDKIAWDSDTWRYSGNKANGSRHVDAREADLASCAPVLTPEQEALREGDVVESIKIPVRADGVPFLGRARLGDSETIECVTFWRSACWEAGFPDGRLAYLHNLRLVRKADA